VLLREKQYAYGLSNEIARNIVINKIENQLNMLNRLRGDEPSGKLLLKDIQSKLQKENLDIYTIMGCEGTAAKVYFSRIFKSNSWQGRQPRVKRDMINVLLDIGYTVLFNYVEALLNLYGFDIYKGNLHQTFFRRKSLVCDMVEMFRPIIDYTTKNMLGLKQIDERDFVKTKDGRLGLEWKQSSKVVSIFLNGISEYRQEMFQYFQQYYRWFMKGGNIATMPKVVIK
jgi:CRISPR-associated protein Cas1